ncbi:MAG: hypothetical protein Q4B54_04925, partial [Coriobacteriales bacterium]|nr:hypothetical protein [Coriobacteriales bacterium]
MVCVLFARAIRRVHPDIPESIVGSYIANARPMLQANETFHNCVTRVTLEYNARLQQFPLTKQCTIFRGKTFAQTHDKIILPALTVIGSAAQMILDLPNIDMKAQVAENVIARSNTTLTYTVSYVGKWKLPQLGKHIRGFWVNTTVGGTPIIQLSAVNRQLFLTIIQPFSERTYYDALLEELRDQGIPYTECGTEPNLAPDVIM